MREIIKRNGKFLIIMLLIVVFGIIGVTVAIKVGNFNPINLSTKTANIDLNLTYDTAVNEAKVTSTDKMLPIADSLVTGPTVSDERVLKVKFMVTGKASNPSNTIYDIALHNAEIDCALRTEDLKWRLYKNNNLISSGNLSPTFDTMSDQRLVLTNTQQDLTTSTDTYVFLLWISESCTGDIKSCTKEQDQSKYLNKSLTADIKIELSTKSKKELVRTTGSALSCSYVATSIPSCNTVTYDGTEQVLINDGDYYTLDRATGINAGTYAVTARVKDGYKWTDGSTDPKVVSCNINKRSVSITSDDLSVDVGSFDNHDTSAIIANNLVSGHSVSYVFINSSVAGVGSGTATPTAVKIVDSSNNDVTDNYNIAYNSGSIDVKCINTATAPTVSNLIYTGATLTGVSGGSNVVITGSKTAKDMGNYKVTVKPESNYCWSDYSTDEKTFTWSIGSNMLNATIANKTVTYTGSAVSSNAVVIKDSNGNTITGPTVTYKYYSGSNCSTSITSAPTAAGNYSVKAIISAYGAYQATESNCALITINKKSSSISLSSFPTSLVYSTGTRSYSYTYTGDSTTPSITCSSSNTSIATCNVDTTNKKINVVSKGIGSTTITVKAAATSTYNASSVSKSLSITCLNTATEPTSKGSVTYTGSVITGVSGGSNITLSGTKSATSVGNYTVTATPNTGYCWSNNTMTTKSYSWSIVASKTATEPSVYNYTYNCNTPTVTGVSGGNNVTLSGTTSSSSTGTFTAYATPKTNYAWSDGTTASKSYTWTVAAHTHVFTARGNTKFSTGFTWTSGGNSYTTAYAIYCRTCGMSALYYKNNYDSSETSLMSPSYPYGTSDGYLIFSDSSVTYAKYKAHSCGLSGSTITGY